MPSPLQRERLRLSARQFVLKQVLPDLIAEVSSTSEFCQLARYKSFRRILAAIHEPDRLTDIVYHRGRSLSRIRVKEERLAARFKLKLWLELTAKCGLTTQIEPIKVWIHLEGDYATEKWRYAIITVKLPEDIRLFFVARIIDDCDGTDIRLERRTLGVRIVL